MFTEIQINDFRALKNKKLQFGQQVTMLAGWNATGKSTVLALLANSSELKANQGKTYHNKPFRAEFSEILKGSKRFDITTSERLCITWENNNKKAIKTFRTGWQKEKGKDRFRVIPKEIIENNKKTEAKFDIPVIYLGLSRLYPIGEIEDDSLKETTQTFQAEEDKQWFIKNYKNLLSLDDNIQDITNIKFQSIAKSTSGVNTNYYDWVSNSAGQDNLSQILFAILSFKNLKNTFAEYKGGVLIIDELESSLHPKAQQKIIDFLIKESKQYQIQILFTTHSLTIIEHFSSKKKSDDGNLEYYYFTKANGEIEIQKSPSFEDMKADLLMPICKKQCEDRITIYTEDAEARWFLSKLLSYQVSKRRLNILNINISCSSLIDLMNCDPSFGEHLVVFDGDLPQTQIKRLRKNKSNFLCLPTNLDANGNAELESPEKTIRNFIFSEDGKKYLEDAHNKNTKIKKEYFKENDLINDQKTLEREKYKLWFNNHKYIFDTSKILDYWKQKNSKQTNDFIEKFKKKFNKIAEKKSIEKI
ncbi:AAA family ATPase [Candidatus Avelusimicrobium fimicolum]|jgi:predicted ATPase|uniref:AAA family ATPase n=1 Tax=Candidatus Avelusimicrobium fimicolum TaxID=3416216 RepID=UPI003D0B9FBB